MEKLLSPEYIAALVALMPLIFGLVEFAKQWVQGKALTIVSLVVGIALGVALYVATFGAPIDFSGWFTAILGGIAAGLAASGFYDFANVRFPAVSERAK